MSTTLEEKLHAAKQEHARAMEQISIWNARAQRAAGAIEILEGLIAEKTTAETDIPVTPTDVDPM